MIHGVWQLAKQSLTSDARRPGPHAVRLGLIVVLYLAICWSSANTWRSAAGLPLFHAQLLATAFYLTINAVFGFSQAISEEKEDETLGLMRLTDISSLSVVMGKMAGRLTDAALLLALQFPFTIIAITLGGVSWAQVYAAYAALAVYLWLLASIGICASVLQPTGVGAARWTAVMTVLYVVPPFLCMTAPLRWQGLIAAYRFISLPLQLSELTESSFDETAWNWPVAFGLLAGLVCLLWAWRAFDGVVVGSGSVKRERPVRRPQRESRRVWSRPVVWADFVFFTGGFPGLLRRTTVHLLILLAMPIFHNELFRVFAWAAIWSGIFALVDGTWSASRLFRDEIRNRTWSSLVQTPHSISRLALDKACGWLLGMLPSTVIPCMEILGSVATLPDWGNEGYSEILTGTLTIEFAIFGYLHLLVLMTLYLGWQATPLTLTISFAAGWLYAVAVHSAPFSSSDRSLVFGFTTVVLVMIALTLQRLIILRLKTLAETA